MNYLFRNQGETKNKKSLGFSEIAAKTIGTRVVAAADLEAQDTGGSRNKHV